MDQLLHGSREEIRKVAESHGATNIQLFGSRARGEAGISSDVDLLVLRDENAFIFSAAFRRRFVSICTVSGHGFSRADYGDLGGGFSR